MLQIFFARLDRIFIDVTKYFAMCKWMNFLDEKILKDGICWTSLDNMTG
jgi:hypothetical protein